MRDEHFPALVSDAMRQAVDLDFGLSCSPLAGKLLRVLAAGVRDGIIGEIGTGCGVGAAWIVSGLQSNTRFVTVEGDPARAAAATRLLRPHANVRVLTGDWRDILAHGPFDLLFVDVAEAKRDEPEVVLNALRPGSMVLLDDLTPEEFWPPGWQGKPDLVREFWLRNPRLVTSELMTDAKSMVILGTRLGD